MDTINNQTTIKQSFRVAARQYDGKSVIVVIDEKKVHVLNPLGSRVWQMADGRSIGEIIDLLAPEYDVTIEQLSSDVLAFVSELHKLGALDLGTQSSK
ncbi:MAG: PqqD family protein [Myxococcales bacterium]|nr:MAG: PqqD family protein [Myxococcales bacterium]